MRMNGRLYRSRRDRMLAGVAGGMADYLGIDPSLVRVGWAILILASGGALLLVYILMAFIVPEEPAGAARSYAMDTGREPAGGASTGEDATRGTASEGESSVIASRSEPGRDPDVERERYMRWGERRERRGSGGLVVGVILIVVGGIFLLREYVPALDWDRLWPIILIAIGAVLLLAAIGGRDRRWGRP
jgi:phage shock protein C